MERGEPWQLCRGLRVGSCQGEGKAWWIAEWGKYGTQADGEVERDYDCLFRV